MISKGNTHQNGVRLANYMTTGKDGERAELWQLRGFEATNIRDAFRDVQITAGATKCEQPFFHVQVRNRDGETLTRFQWEQAADRIERMLGLADQPRAIAFHIDEKTGHEHMHIAWSRIDQETLTAIPLPFFKERLKKISRELELHFGLEAVTNRREGNIKYAPTRAEDEQARRLGLDIHAIRNTIRACYERSDCGASFQAALEHQGMILARGEKRDFIVIDREGGMHALGKRMLDDSAAKIRARFSDLSRDDLPTVEQARLLMLEKGRQEKKEAQRAKPEPVWDREREDRTWQDAVIRAAIEKEKAERKFVEPEQRQSEAGGRKKEKEVRAERPLDAPAAAIRLAWSLSRSPQDFIRNLDESGFRLARTTKEEAERSHRNAAFAKETGGFARELREGDYVAIGERGQLYSLDRRTTGKSGNEIAAFLRTLDATKIQGIEATQDHIATQKRPAPAREHWQRDSRTAWQSFGSAAHASAHRDEAPRDLRGPAAEIRTAFERSDNARAFVNALRERSIAVAVVTRDDVANAAIDRLYANDLRPMPPPRLREGDYVAITDDGRVYNLNQRTTGVSAERAQKFMETLDRKTFPGVYETLKVVQERAALHDIQRQAFRDLSAGRLKRERDTRPAGRLGKAARARAVGKVRSATNATVATTMAAARVAAKTLDAAADAFSSLFAPQLTPEQKAVGRAGELRREAEAQQAVDFSRYTAEMAQQNRRQEENREAVHQRERDGRER